MRNDTQTSKDYKYESIRNKLLDEKQFPRSNKIINLPQFVIANESLYMKLINTLEELKAGQKSPNEPSLPRRPYPTPITEPTQSEQEQLSRLTSHNQHLRNEIVKIKEEQQTREMNTVPILKEKQEQIEKKEQELNTLKILYEQQKQALKNKDLLELYEEMCRECEEIRRSNNELNEEIKQAIEEGNRLAGTDENADRFLMNLKL